MFEEIKLFGRLYYKSNENENPWRIKGLDWSLIFEECVRWVGASRKDIQGAIFIEEEKVSSLYGSILAFYQKSWNTIKEDLLKLFFLFIFYSTIGIIRAPMLCGYSFLFFPVALFFFFWGPCILLVCCSGSSPFL